MRKLWGGAFGEASDELVDRFGQSIESDLRFWREDVTGSIAHARMLGATGILSEADAAELVRGLEVILAEEPDGLPRDVEDIHTAVEDRLPQIVGLVAGRLHTARSRNDQVATDARLYFRAQFEELKNEVKQLQEVLLANARTHRSTVMPGYTHQQPAQPITLGLHQLAHFWAMQRHGKRIENLIEFINWSPLGSAALAGTGFPIDRTMTAKELGFNGPIPNALDATSDRSFILDGLHVTTSIMIDLSRIAQELIVWSGAEYGFVRLSDRVTTGSSIMPQKRNPDMAELIRGRTGRAIGNWTAFAATMKALPLGYNRDTQDDKPALFESLDLTRDALQLTALMLQTATWNKATMRKAAGYGFSTATDVADFLAASGMPFRQAHHVTGRVVALAAARNAGLEDLSLDELKTIEPAFGPDVLEVLGVDNSVASRTSYGGTAPANVKAQAEDWLKRLHAEAIR